MLLAVPRVLGVRPNFKGGSMAEKKTSRATREKLQKKLGAVTEAAPVPIEERKLTVGAKKKICIVGFAPGREKAPYDDPSFEFWGVNEMYMAPDVKKIDVLFEIHDYKWIKEGKRYKDHLKWLRDQRKTVIMMQTHFDDIPNSVPFPREPLEEAYGSYFTNTISWEIALATYIGVEEIHIYGVNMATDIEYQSQRPSCEYYVGIAKGKGIKVYIPPESDLLKCFYQYGFEDGELSIMSQRMKQLEEEQGAKRQHFDNQVNLSMIERSRAEGAQGAFEQVNKAFVYPHSSWEHTKEE